MTTLAAILRHKGTDVAHVSPNAAIADVVRFLSERRIGAALVLDAGRRIMGVVSERDIVRSLASHGAGTLEMTAEQLMTCPVQTATPATTVAEAMGMMTEGRFRHIPVMEGDRLAGIVSIGDVVKARITEQEAEVDSLKAYVAGAA